MNLETVASIVAIFVALCALGVSVWQGFETRKNYRLSVTPSIRIIGNFLIYKEEFGIIVENKGIGPAIIHDIEINFSNKKYNFLSDPHDFMADLKAKCTKMPRSFIGFHTFDYAEYLSAGDAVSIFYIYKPDEEQAEFFRKIITSLSIKIVYKSVYGNFFETNYIVTQR